ncbi:hypothetical protein E2C01_033000 [Portunus trituberculatus]|uniref:Uncharacterized protein n=1 Tax=Portunus trituberculatus TaxID=210409 RepID=A0A5B7F308_PORTR|nr:hypothetical protein [Portunus trituberculatus]
MVHKQYKGWWDVHPTVKVASVTAPPGMDVLVVLEKFCGDVVDIKCVGCLCSGPKVSRGYGQLGRVRFSLNIQTLKTPETGIT